MLPTASLALFLVAVQISAVLPTKIGSFGCGVSKGCWFEPQGCETELGTDGCQYMFTWRVESDSLVMELGANLSEIQQPLKSRFMAVGFSYDDRMGDDSVVECVVKPTGQISTYMSFNDRFHNFKQYEAGSAMLSNFSASLSDDILLCQVTRMFQLPDSFSDEDKMRNFDIGSGSWTLMLAKGYANPNTDQLIVHGLTDDDFPWISRDSVDLRSLPTVIKSSKHFDIKRSITKALAKAHGVLFLIAWWIFGTASLFIARYFKDLWPKTKLCGTKIWFQLHRDLMIISLILQLIAFALVFIESRKWHTCTHVCTSDDYALKIHAILGLTTTIIAVIQPFLAWFRPGPNDFKRPYFNSVHWFLGMTSWLLATVTIFVSPPLAKTGLKRNYKYAPNYLMAGYISAYILTTIVLEKLFVAAKLNAKTDKQEHKLLLANATNDTNEIGNNVVQTGVSVDVQMSFLSGPKSSDSNRKIEIKPRDGYLRTITLCWFMAVALGIVIALSVMICL